MTTRRPTAAEREQTLVHLDKQIKDIDFAMLTTVGEGGRLVSRPLSTRQTHLKDGVVRFFTDRPSAKVGELKRDPRVNLSYASPERNVFISIAGTSTITDDPSVKDALWSDEAKAFWPKGKHDPNLVVLEVHAETLEAWEGPSSWIGKAVGFIVARVTGDESALGEQVRLDLAKERPTSTAGRKTPATPKAPAAKKDAATRTSRSTPAKSAKPAQRAKSTTRQAPKRPSTRSRV